MSCSTQLYTSAMEFVGDAEATQVLSLLRLNMVLEALWFNVEGKLMDLTWSSRQRDFDERLLLFNCFKF